MLGDQAATHERRRQLRLLGREAEVAHQRHHQSEPRAGPVYGGDDRLADREREGHGAGVVGAAETDPVTVPGQGLEILHIGPGAEAAAGAGDDDRADGVITLGATPTAGRSKRAWSLPPSMR